MPTSKDINRVALTTPSGLLAFGFGSGLSPVAPGTAGSLMAIPFFLLLAQLPVWIYLASVILLFGLGVLVSSRASEQLGEDDFGGIVIDEMVGMWITLLACPLDWLAILAGFVLFRFFDVIKPQPIKWFDRHLKGGLGIMVDDVIAGLFALLCLQGLLWAGWLPI